MAQSDENGTGTVRPAASSDSQDANLPLFYRRIELMQEALHRDKVFRDLPVYRHATGANAVPIQLQEFRNAALYYPIVFPIDDTAPPVCVLGVERDENLYVDKEGRWTPAHYVPAYVKRYPFASAKIAGQDELTLVFDPSSDLIGEDLEEPCARPLFEDGEPTDAARHILSYCRAYEQWGAESQDFIREIHRHNLLTPQEVTFTSETGEQKKFSGYRAIDERRFEVLAQEAILEWRSKGWIAAVYAHLISLGNFVKLFPRRTSAHGPIPLN